MAGDPGDAPPTTRTGAPPLTATIHQRAPEPDTAQGGGIAAWRAHWRERGAPWRTEPEIPPERQAYLTARRATTADPAAGAYPLSAVTPNLTRADVEWLLATHENGRGPIDWSDETQRGRPGLDLRGAILDGLDLRGLPLARARACLTFDEARDLPDVQKAHEAAAIHLEAADLTGASLEEAEFTYGHCDGATFDGAQITDFRASNAHLNRCGFRRARMTGAYLHLTELAGAHFEGADLDDAELGIAQADGAHFEGASLRNVRLFLARLENAHLDDANLENAGIESAHLKGASLARANLHLARLRGADLAEADLEGANLRRALLDEWVLSGTTHTTLTNAHLAGACLADVHLERADLQGADLTRADLTRARLEGANLTSARLAGADLRRAVFDPATIVDNVLLDDGRAGPPRVSGLRWGGANLMLVDWSRAPRLGDESRLQRAPVPRPLGAPVRAEPSMAPPAEPQPPRDRAARRTASLAGRRDVVHAYQQLAQALQKQGLGERAAPYAYRGQVLQRRLYLRQAFWQRRPEQIGRYLFSLLLAVLTGYGHRMGRILIAYALVVAGCAAGYFALGVREGPPITWPEAVLVSITAFHGRVYAAQFPPGSLQSWATVFEAVVGLVIEGIFIAMLTQRFFGD